MHIQTYVLECIAQQKLHVCVCVCGVCVCVPAPTSAYPREVNELFAFWDFFATAAELAGIEQSALPPHDGVSILPTLLDEVDKQQNHTYLYWYVSTHAQTDDGRGRGAAPAAPPMK